MTSDERWEVARSFFADSVKPQDLQVIEQRKAGCMWNSWSALCCHMPYAMIMMRLMSAALSPFLESLSLRDSVFTEPL